METNLMLKASHISKTFYSEKGNAFPVLDNVSVEVRKNEFLVLLGPGQCGKTVLLNIIAGLIPKTTGEMTLDGEEIDGPNEKIAYVFQKTGIFEWMTAVENVELGLKYRGIEKKTRREIAKKYLDMVGLAGFENAYPKQLSGGMKQRVGIARAYAISPQLLLMDEPFGALDAQTRYSMENEVLRIWEKEKSTVVFVTNNIEEAITLGDRIIQFTERPARVKKVYDLSSLPRPRDNMDPEFLRIRTEISENEELTLE